MNFFEWLQDDEINTFLERVKYHILSSIRLIGEKQVGINFPKNYEMLAQTQPRLQVAHTVYEYDLSKTLRMIQANPGVNWGNPKEIENKLKPGLRHIARHMGLKFECDVFMGLVKDHKLSVVGEKDVSWVSSFASKQQASIIAVVGEPVAQKVFQLIEHHSKEMCQAIYTKSQQVLKTCMLTHVIFSGGEHVEEKRNTADIILGCGSSSVGVSLKYTSENDVNLAQFRSPVKIYELMGGTRPSEFSQEVSQREGSKRKRYISQSLFELAQKMTIRGWNSFINTVLFGARGEMAGIIPAFTNYSKGRSNVGFSPSVKKNFNASDTQQTFSIKPDANIDVRHTKTQVKITIQAGPTKGSVLTFRIEEDGQVKISMNNLVT